MVENSEFAAFAVRILRAMARRADADVESLPTLRNMQEQIEILMRESVSRCRAEGYSWGEIAARLGCTRQAAQQRYGVKAALTPNDEDEDEDEDRELPEDTA